MKLKGALLVGKLIFFLTRIIRFGGGSAAPGLYALKIYPKLIEELSKRIKYQVIIAGTNGKTTTARLLTLFAQEQNLKVLNNRTGSNLERGVASTLISYISLKDIFKSDSSFKLDLAIWETDEAAFNKIAPQINPNLVVFLNIFRDQLDRYGEIDTTLKKWSQTLNKLSKNTQILINSDDHNLLDMAKSMKQSVLTFSSQIKINGEKIISGYRQKKSNFNIRDIKTYGLKGSQFNVYAKGIKFTSLYLPLPGIYQLYNFLGAFSLGLQLNLDPKLMIRSLTNFSPAFGRVEKVQLNKEGQNCLAYIFLIKNPTGTTQVLQTISSELTKQDNILLALNDNPADGKDVSWIWDTDFEILATKPRNCLIVSGNRCLDLSNRLKYAGLSQNNISIESNLEKAFIKASSKLSGRLFILVTYTALLELQKLMTKQGIKKHYWQEK